jgi:acyl-CoA dehydrogenase family protein 9
VRETTGYGTDKILRELHPTLRKAAETYEKYVVELSKSSDALLRKYGKKIADQQYQQKRIADIAIDMFVGLCTLSRADAMVKGKHADAESAVAIAEVFTKQARRRMSRNVRGQLRNEDAQIDKLAGAILGKGAYPWDVI